MLSVLEKTIKNKNVLILGFGREGQSTLKRLLQVGCAAKVTVADMNDVNERVRSVAESCVNSSDGADPVSGIGVIFGPEYMDTLCEYDVIFKSPGVVLPTDAQINDGALTSEIDIFMQAYRDRVIGITGTKGKSTTSSLMYHVLKESGKDVAFGGNIGIPVFDLYEEIGPETTIVLELSCHQLEYLQTDPHIAVLLNIYEDHLDHYGTRERYAAAKKNIFLSQKEGDVLYTTKETFENENLKEGLHSNLEIVFADDAPFKSFDEIPDATLIGEHNRLNCAFVWKAVKEKGITKEEFLKALKTFKSLPHRLERFATIKGMDFYDDSISTTVKSAISAVEAVAGASILLLGGMERNIDYEELVRYLGTSDLKLVICMYESGKRIFDMIEAEKRVSESGQAKGGASFPKTVYVEDLEGAVDQIKIHEGIGGACILSPAAASYGYFKNFEERGDKFKEYVNSKLKN